MDEHLDIFGQQPILTMNTQICFAFSLTPASSHRAVINTLTNGLKRLYAEFPWLACEIVNEGSGEGNTGIYKFKALAEAPSLIVKDFRQNTSMPTMDVLKSADFPMRMMQEDLIAPRKAFPEDTSQSAPVFLIQANFITDGLILTFVAQHNTMDMTGQAHVIHLFSKACRNEEFTSEEISSGNLPRQSIVPLLEMSYTPGPELHRNIVKSNSPPLISDPTSQTSAKCTWAYFTFLSLSLALLKSLASEVVTPPAYISTDDALTAFIWQSVLRARLPRLNPTTQSTIARAVDVRPYLEISPMYTGPIQDCVHSTHMSEELVLEHLGNIAAQLRSAIDPETSNVEFHARAIATLLSRTPNKATFSLTANFDTSVDLILSSWSRVKGYELDFNLGAGKPEAIRRPQFQAIEGLAYFMPKTVQGDIVVALCLREEDMARLRADTKFATYGTYIG